MSDRSEISLHCHLVCFGQLLSRNQTTGSTRTEGSCFSKMLDCINEKRKIVDSPDRDWELTVGCSQHHDAPSGVTVRLLWTLFEQQAVSLADHRSHLTRGIFESTNSDRIVGDKASPYSYYLSFASSWRATYLAVLPVLVTCSSWNEVIAVPFIDWEQRRRQWWSANVTRTFEQSVFNEIHTIHALRLPWKA
jgi:hypothetical protein